MEMNEHSLSLLPIPDAEHRRQIIRSVTEYLGRQKLEDRKQNVISRVEEWLDENSEFMLPTSQNTDVEEDDDDDDEKQKEQNEQNQNKMTKREISNEIL
jgi:hypothetical protein